MVANMSQPDESNLTPEERIKNGYKHNNGLFFFFLLKPINDFHYAGRGVVLGAKDWPICWYRPKGSVTYRVIFADLSVQDMSPEEVAPLQKYVLKSEEISLEEIERSLTELRKPQIQSNACMENLAKFRGAKTQWALDNNAGPSAEPTLKDIVGPKRYIRKMPVCLMGGMYSLNRLDKNPSCSVPEHVLP